MYRDLRIKELKIEAPIASNVDVNEILISFIISAVKI